LSAWAKGAAKMAALAKTAVVKRVRVTGVS
jgi:hypothetical protein